MSALLECYEFGLRSSIWYSFGLSGNESGCQKGARAEHKGLITYIRQPNQRLLSKLTLYSDKIFSYLLNSQTSITHATYITKRHNLID